MTSWVEPSGVAHRLSRGLGVPCEAIEGQRLDFGGRERAILVVFVNGLGGAGCLWILEHSLAVTLAGACLHQSPDALLSVQQQDVLPDSMVAALREFFLRSPSFSGEDLGFSELHVGSLENPRPDIEALLYDAPRNQALQLTVQGYGAGRLTTHGL